MAQVQLHQLPHAVRGGAYYAPDLTKITQHRGEPYQGLHAGPSKFYDEKIHRRLMPRQDLSEEEISDLIAFLDWVSKVDNQGWPPRPILVTGSFVPGADTLAQGSAGRDDAPPGARPVAADDDERALGEKVFRTAVPACNACHSTAPGRTWQGRHLPGSPHVRHGSSSRLTTRAGERRPRLYP